MRGVEVAALILVAAGVLGVGPVPRTLSDLRIRSETNETVIEALIGRDIAVEDRTGETRTAGPDAGSLPEGAVADDERRTGAPATEAEGGTREGLRVRHGQKASAAEPKRPPGLVSAGDIFAEEIRIRLPDAQPRRSTSIIVGDPLVSEVRVLSQEAGSVLVVFVRQPVHYEVWRVGGGRTLRVHIRPGQLVVPGRGAHAVISGRGDEREVTVDAETVRYDQQENVILASGGVAVKRPGSILTADTVRVNRSTYDGEAAGRVVLRTEGTVVRGDYVHLNLADETGWIEGGEIEFPAAQSEYVILGERISKGFGQNYRVSSGVLTTCRCGGLEPPSWSVASRRLDVDVLGRGTARHLTLRVHDVPVFYWPWGIFPVNSTRQSGFLMPRVGMSESRGFKYEQPFYWAIDRSSDATVAFDIETSARAGGVGEYRYALDPNSRGILAGAYFNETLRSEEDLRKAVHDYAEKGIFESPTDERWGVFSEIQQRLPADVRAYANTTLVGDDLFFTEIQSASFEPAKDEAARTLFYTASRVGMLKKWQGAQLWGESAFFQDLDLKLENEDDAVFQRLPGVELSAQRAVMNDRLVLSFAGEGVDYQRRVGFDGLRFDLQPEARMPFRIGRVAFGSLEVSARETLYHLTDRDRIGRCGGGDRDGKSCTANSDCTGGGSCKVNYRCSGGKDEGKGCTADSDCGGGGSCGVIEPTGTLRDRDSTRELVQLGWNLGTEIARVYPFQRWGFSELKHTIEPTVSYLFVPLVGGQDELPLFDSVDRVNRRSLFGYGLVSRLKARLGKGASGEGTGDESSPAAPSVRELARVSLLQVYDTKRKISGDSHLSDVDLGLRITPNKLLALQYGATYNPMQNEIKGTSVNFSVREPWQAGDPQLALLQMPSHLSVSFRSVRENVAAVVSDGQEELGGSLYLRIGRFFGLFLQGRANLLAEKKGQEGGVIRASGVGARFISRCNCWMLEVGADKREDIEETLVRAQLTLAGIGSLGRARDQGLLTGSDLRR